MDLGIALGAFANEWNRQREMKRLDEREAREKEQFGWQRRTFERQQGELDRQEQLRARASQLIGDYNQAVTHLSDLSNPEAQTWLRDAGRKYGFGNFNVVNGKILNVIDDPATQQSRVTAVDPRMLRQQMDASLMRELATLAPENALGYLTNERNFERQVGRDAAEDRFRQGALDIQSANVDLGREGLGLRRDALTQEGALARERMALEERMNRARIAATRSAAGGQARLVGIDKNGAGLYIGGDGTVFSKQITGADGVPLSPENLALLQSSLRPQNQLPNETKEAILADYQTLDPSDGEAMGRFYAKWGSDALRGVGIRTPELKVSGAQGQDGGLPTRQPAEPVAPRDWGFSTDVFDDVLDAARRGSGPHQQQVLYWLSDNALTIGQRTRAAKILGVR